jgi:hypothetical protein
VSFPVETGLQRPVADELVQKPATRSTIQEDDGTPTAHAAASSMPSGAGLGRPDSTINVVIYRREMEKLREVLDEHEARGSQLQPLRLQIAPTGVLADAPEPVPGFRFVWARNPP